ncbi:hypothetical protein D1641_09645 [Colidextribacter sp. OB.20]|uniref:hypothetical protein n=1 Tax=Colidextribacter sp. OB.20 TaxID=2304568 RepID=UPI00136D2C46|nr:hypothetical protein [Colidextribacter sp. OB.20]NBI10271.1 hypothetical protein [Colidextribacter sp. OB.20]
MDYGNNGYIGTWLCGEDGVFAPIPTITLTFSKSYPETLPGLTLTWSTVYDEWASLFRVTAYHSGRAVFSGTMEGTAPQTILEGDIGGYDKLTIEVLKWSTPRRRARIESVFLGIESTYTKKDIIQYSVSMFADPLSAALPKSEITFELDNRDGRFNLDNLKGEGRYLMERQEVNVRYGYKLEGANEWISGGTYYLSQWDAPQNGITATFTARDALELMGDPYTGPSSGTLKEIAEAAFTQSGLSKMSDGTDRWAVSSSLENIQAPEGLDLSRYSVAEVLQYASNAGCCVFYQDRAGKLHIEKLNPALTDYPIDRFVSYEYAEIALSRQLKAVNVNNGQFELAVGLKGETQPISNPLISDEQAPNTAAWAADYLQNRRTLSGNYRADPRLDPLDMVRNQNRFANTTVLITTVRYTWNGAFRGSYEGRGMDNASAYFYYAGDIYSGEV